METKFFDRIRSNLTEKRDYLAAWLLSTPNQKKKVLLGPSPEGDVHVHLEHLDKALRKAKEDSLGRCEICNETVETRLLEMDYTCCVCLEHLSAEERRHLELELEMAQDVQRTLLPREVPDLPVLDIAAYSRPAQIVGGDYFDFFRFADGNQGIAIADVAGHGMSASLQMASVQTLLRTLGPANTSPSEVVRHIHKLYIYNIHYANFVTLFLGSFDPTTYTLTYCNAGHNPPLLYRDQEPVEWLSLTGAAIGLVEEADYRSQSIQLAPGDVLLLYTDGVTETENSKGEMFGENRLIEIIRRGSGASAKALINAVRYELQEFAGGVSTSDDTTYMVLQVKNG